MNSRKLAARALTLLPALVIAGAALVQVRTELARVRAAPQPHAVTFLLDRPAAARPASAPHGLRPARARL